MQQVEDRIRVLAYEIYEERGRKDGHALEDWVEAKAQVLGVARNPQGCIRKESQSCVEVRIH
jgi:hypothetical protein